MSEERLSVEDEAVEDWGSVERFEPGQSNRAVTLLAAVAAMGGFLFGFDTAVINGAVEAIGDHFHAASGALGFAVASALLGCAVGALVAGRLADRYGRSGSCASPRCCSSSAPSGSGLAFGRLGPDPLAGRRRHRRRHRVGDRARLHRRDRAGADPRPARLAAAAGHRRSASSSRCSSTPARHGCGRRVGGRFWLGLRRGGGCSSSASSRRSSTASSRFDHPGVAALPRGQGAARGGARRCCARCWATTDVDGEDRATSSSTLGARDEARPGATCAARRVGLLPIVWVGILLSVFQQFVGINVIFYYSTTLWQAVGFSETDSLHHHRDHLASSTSSPRSSRSRWSTRSGASRCCSSARSAWP